MNDKVYILQGWSYEWDDLNYGYWINLCMSLNYDTIKQNFDKEVEIMNKRKENCSTEWWEDEDNNDNYIGYSPDNKYVHHYRIISQVLI